jgi:FkbM family methyltransferase
MKKEIKSLTHKIGIYPLARSLYRLISSEHRKEKHCNKRFYSQLISPGDLCFDIGANVGQTIEALLAADAVVVAVEPNPNCLPVLDYQFKRNTNLTIIPKAMGASTGFADLHFNESDSTASIREDWPFPNQDTTPVEIITLDSLIAEFGRPKFIKVDVEGYELEVFKGLSQPIPLIYFEMHGCEADTVTLILSRLAEIGEILGVNAINSENADWLFDEWEIPQLFLARLGQSLPRRANVVVKMKANSST